MRQQQILSYYILKQASRYRAILSVILSFDLILTICTLSQVAIPLDIYDHIVYTREYSGEDYDQKRKNLLRYHSWNEQTKLAG